MIQIKRSSTVRTDTFDVLIAAVGYEARATHIARHLGDSIAELWAFDYAREKVLSYENNQRWFASQPNCSLLPDSDHRRQLHELLDALARASTLDAENERGGPRIAVDISCMDRDVIAASVLALLKDRTSPIRVTFFYSPATFDESLKGSEGTVLVNRPVRGFEGWTRNPDAGLVCLLGLGFESRLALAAIETLEPSWTIALLPKGEDPRYDEVVSQRNASLVQSEPGIPQHAYCVNDVYQTIQDIDASVSALTRRGRVVLVPLGPKPLALASMLVAAAHEHDVTVWRLSAGSARTPEDRFATGSVVSVDVGFVPQSAV